MTRLGRTILLLAAVAGFLIPAPADAACGSGYPVTDKRLANHSCTGIHPGMGLRVPSKKYGELTCVAGFVFTDSLGNKYVSVPGTCHLDFTCLEDVVVDLLPPPLDQLVGDIVPCIMPSESEQEPVYGRNGPAVRDLDGTRIGAIVYAVNKSGVNFALIRIDAGRKVDPAVPLYGGPTRLTGPSGELGEQAYVYSAHYNDQQPNAGTGLLQGGSAGRVYHQSVPLLLGGSGAPVVKPDGAGVGYYSGTNYVGSGNEVLSYGPALEREERHARIKLKLVTAAVSS